MKALITAVMVTFAATSFAAEPAKKAEVKKDVANCVKKDKDGKCLPEAKKKEETKK